MSETNYGHPGNEGADPGSSHHPAPQDPRPYWKRAHLDWKAWIALFLMLFAMAIYVLSDNLAFLPHPWR